MCSDRRVWLISALVIMIGWGCRLPGDEVYLTDGRVIEGEIISAPNAEVVDIRVGSAGLVAIQHFPRATVVRVVHRVSARQSAMSELQQRIDLLGADPAATAADWWALTRQLQDRGEHAAAKDLAIRVVALDRQHADARKLLGMSRYNGIWMRPNEIATARGQVFFRGAWVAWAEQEETLADEARRKEEHLAQRRERAEQRRQARIAAAVAAESAAALQETYVSGYYRSPYYNPYGGWNYPAYRPMLPGYPLYPLRPYPNQAWCPPVGWHVGGSGGGSHHAWSFSWGGGSLIR